MNDFWEIAQRDMVDAVKVLMRLPEELKKELFNGTLRKFDGDKFYVGKIYDIHLDFSEDENEELVGNAQFVALFNREYDTFFSDKKHIIKKLNAEKDLNLFANLALMRRQFREDLGPVANLFKEVEVENATFD